jgi:peptidoglycan hydrolase-like protein with peptidoglycan-binding domain/beta-N-acetylglucosaminidase
VNLTLGSKGNQVKQVQAQLIKLGYNCGTVDGVYGPSTYSAVKAFQQRNHLTVDGVVGPQTWSKLFSNSAVKASPHDTSGSSSSRVPSSNKSSFYEAFTGSAVGTRLQGVTYSSISDAKRAAGSNGFVVDLRSNVIVEMPKHYYFERNGKWYLQSGGSQILESNKAPKFARNGVLYYSPVEAQSPHYVNYYVLSSHSNGNEWLYDGAYAGHWENPYRQTDLKLPSGQTAQQLDKFIYSQNNRSSLYGLGSSYVDAEKAYGTNAVYLLAHSVIESAWGNSSIAQSKNNLFGYGAYDRNPGSDAGSFPTDDYAIHFEAWEVRHNYLTKDPNNSYSHYVPSLGPTLDGMSGGGYATDPDWSPSIAAVIDQYASQPGNAFTSSSKEITADAQDQNGPPIYYTNGFVAKSPQYPGQPIEYNPDVVSDTVKTLQNALNAAGAGPIEVDGAFGKATMDAVKQFQKSIGVSQTGIVDKTTWNALFPNYGSSFAIDEMKMSMVHGLTMEYCHIASGPAAGKWVWEPFIHFTNVYRVEPINGPFGPQARIVVYKSTSGQVLTDGKDQIYLHAGDYVVNNNNGAPINGWVHVGFTEWHNGQPKKYNGYVKASELQFIGGRLPMYNGLQPSSE